MKEISEIKLQTLPIFKKAGVSRSFVFGSYARKEANKNSDLNLIVEFNKRKSIIDLITLKLELEKELGIKVDVLTSNSIHPKIRSLIQEEKIQIL